MSSRLVIHKGINNVTRGFTLIEILVVLFIVSIMTGVVVANLPSITQTADFEEEVKRLEIVLELAREEALVQSSEFGFAVERDRVGRFTIYRFLRYNELQQSWENYETRPLQPHTMADGIEMELQIEGEGFSLDSDETEEENGIPPVMLLSSGETTPFELLVVEGRERERTLVADGYAQITQKQEPL